MIYFEIKMSMRDSVEIERPARGNMYPRVFSTRIEGSAVPRCNRRVIRRAFALSVKKSKGLTRESKSAIYFDRSHAQPSVDTPVEKESRDEALVRVNTC